MALETNLLQLHQRAHTLPTSTASTCASAFIPSIRFFYIFSTLITEGNPVCFCQQISVLKSVSCAVFIATQHEGQLRLLLSLSRTNRFIKTNCRVFFAFFSLVEVFLHANFNYKSSAQMNKYVVHDPHLFFSRVAGIAAPNGQFFSPSFSVTAGASSSSSAKIEYFYLLVETKASKGSESR